MTTTPLATTMTNQPMPNLRDVVDYIFSEDGPLAKRKGQWRKTQAELAAHNCAVIMGKDSDKVEVHLVEAETGIGKSLATLIPLAVVVLLDGRSSAIATGTIQLREQLTSDSEIEDVNFVVKAAFAHLGIDGYRPITIAARPAHTSFIDKKKVEKLRPAASKVISEDTAHLMAFCDFVKNYSGDPTFEEWLHTPESGGRLPSVGYDGSAESRYQLQQLDVSVKMLTDKLVSTYHTAKSRAENADIMVITHSMLTSAALTEGEKIEALPGGDRRLLVIDEADGLLNLSSSHHHMVSVDELEDIWGSIHTKTIDGDTVDAVVKETEAAMADICQYVRGVVLSAHAYRPVSITATDNGFRETFISSLEVVHKNVGKLVRLHGTPIDVLRWDQISGPIHRMLTYYHMAGASLKYLREQRWTDSDIFGVKEQDETRFGLMPVSSHPIVNRIWMWGLTSFETVILMSATLKVDPRADEFCKRVGIWEPKSVRAFRSTGFGKVKNVYYAHSRNPLPIIKEGEEYFDSEVYLDGLAKTVLRAHTSGRTLVLLRSDNAVVKLRDRLVASGKTVFAQRAGIKSGHLMPDFEKHPDAIWIGLKWAGENFVGTDGRSLLARVMIGKIPYSVAEGPVEAHITSRGINMGYSNSARDALRLIIQGIGRGIRNMLDEIDVWICDPRFPKPAHTQWMMVPEGANPKDAFSSQANKMLEEKDAFKNAKSHLVIIDKKMNIKVESQSIPDVFGW